MRLRGISEEGDELNPKLGELVKTLTGVDLTDANGEFRSTYEIIAGIAAKWDELNSKEQAIILEEVAGKNQANVLASILQNSESLTKSYEALSDAAGSAKEEQEAYMNSIAGKANALRENFRGIFFDLIDTNAVKDTLDVVNSAVEGFRLLADKIGSFPAVVGAATLAFTMFNEKGRTMASTFVDMIPGLNRVDVNLNKFRNSLLKTKADKINFIKATERWIEIQKASGQSFTISAIKLVGYKTQLKLTQVAMAATEAAAIAMNAALSTGLSMLVSAGVSALYKWIDGARSSKKELIELNKEFKNAFSEKENTLQLTKQYKELANQLKNTARGTEEYASISNKLKSVEGELAEKYPKLNTEIAKNGDLKWKNVEAVEALTAKELEQARVEARLTLSKNKVHNSDDIREAIKDYDKLIVKQRELVKAHDNGDKQITIGSRVINVDKELEKVSEKVKTSKESLEAMRTALLLLGNEGTEKFGDSLSKLDGLLGYTKTEIEELSDSTNKLGENFNGAAGNVDKLTESFSSQLQPLKLLNTMIEEFEKYGALTESTYEKVLTSGHTQLIALLGDENTMLENSYALREKLYGSVGDAAKALIDYSVQQEGMFNGVVESANEAADAVSESMKAQTDAMNGYSNVNLDKIKAEYNGLINAVTDALKLTGDASIEMENTIIDSVRTYVAQGNELYGEDLANKISVDEAKKMSSEMWKNEEIFEIAEMVLQNKDLYDTDMINWANNVINKETDGRTYADEVVMQVAEMITLNASNYSNDVVNWASAIQNKSENNVRMVNNIIQSIAKMILANSQNYSDDVVNWAKAINDKSTNNDTLCNNITRGMSDVVNNLSTQYDTDAKNFASLMDSKKKSLGDFMRENMMERRFSYSPKYKDFLDAAKKPFGNNNDGGFNVNTDKIVSTYQGEQVSPVKVTGAGGNYVGSIPDPKKEKKEKKEKKDVADLKDLTNRYYDVNNALKKVENQIAAVETELSSKTGKDRIALLEKEIMLLEDKKAALMNIQYEQERELNELRGKLSGLGVSFAEDGQISNYNSFVGRLVANANSQTGEAKEEAIKNVKEVVEQLNTYTDLLLKDVPDITNKINGITGSVTDLRDEIDQIIKGTTYFVEDFVDKYYAVNNALKKVENQIAAIETELSSKTGKDRIALLEKEIMLLEDKRIALIGVRNEQYKELDELRGKLSGLGVSFAEDGQISNYNMVIAELVANANVQIGEAKEEAIKNVEEVIEQLNTYTDMLMNDIPDITNQINGITGSVMGLRDEIEQIIKDTTYFTKDFVDRYYELNNALKKVENELNAISVAIKNADDNKMVELLDKQIELYNKQSEALAAIRQENVKELNELGRELYDVGFTFNDDGTLANYQSLIDKMVQDANNITDGKAQEKAIKRIEELLQTVEKYTDLLIDKIPEISNDMDDLANSVIDSQKNIADILSKQKDAYIDNLKKETEALKKEVARRKEILEKQWKEEDAADELAEKQRKLNELEDQLTIALRTGDEELIKNIREQITAAQKEINDFIRDQERDYISDRFDEDLDKIDEDLEAKLGEIEEKLSDEQLLNLVQSGVRDLTDVLNKIEKGSKGVRGAFAAIGTTISETWMDALETFMDKLESISDVNLDFNINSKLSKVKDGIAKSFNINQGNLIVQGNITEDVLPIVQNMIDVANNNLIRDINAAFSR